MWASLIKKIKIAIGHSIFKCKTLWSQTKFECTSLWCISLWLQIKVCYITLKWNIEKILIKIQDIFNFSILYMLFLLFLLCCATGLTALVLLCLLAIDMWISPLDGIHIIINLWQNYLYSLQNIFNVLKDSILSLNIKHERSELWKMSNDEIIQFFPL